MIPRERATVALLTALAGGVLALVFYALLPRVWGFTGASGMDALAIIVLVAAIGLCVAAIVLSAMGLNRSWPVRRVVAAMFIAGVTLVPLLLLVGAILIADMVAY